MLIALPIGLAVIPVMVAVVMFLVQVAMLLRPRRDAVVIPVARVVRASAPAAGRPSVPAPAPVPVQRPTAAAPCPSVLAPPRLPVSRPRPITRASDWDFLDEAETIVHAVRAR